MTHHLWNGDPGKLPEKTGGCGLACIVVAAAIVLALGLAAWAKG